jgi:hypothetical protein
VVETEGNPGLAQVKTNRSRDFPHTCTCTLEHKGSASSTRRRMVGLHSRGAQFNVGTHVQARGV